MKTIEKNFAKPCLSYNEFIIKLETINKTCKSTQKAVV